MPSCVLRYCRNYSRAVNKNHGITYHGCQKWVEACKRPDLFERSLERLKYTYICSMHFDKAMYGKRCLKKSAVPTLCLPIKRIFWAKQERVARFPKPGKEKREEWIKFVQINRREDTWKPSEDSRICSLHFKESDKYTTKTGRTYLKRTAEPFDFPETAIPETPEADESAGMRRRALLPLIKRAEEIIIRVYNYLQTEYEELKSSIGANCDLSPLADILKRTAAATGISAHTVSAILDEKTRAPDDESNAVPAKRVRLAHKAGDENVSAVTDEESSGEAPDEEQADDHQQMDDDSEERGECSVQTLKVEIEEGPFYRPPDPLQSQMNESDPGIERQSPANIAHVTIKTEPIEVKIEPLDTEYTQCSSDVVPMTSLATVKTEPDGDPPHSAVSASGGDMVRATWSDVNCDPPVP